MAGTREKWSSKAKPVPITAGSRRPARSHRPVDRFVPGASSSSSANSRSHQTPPDRVVPYASTSLVIRLKISAPSVNAAAPSYQTQPSNSLVLVNTNSTTGLQSFSANPNPTNSLPFSTTANSISDFQPFANAANQTTNSQSFSVVANSTTNLQTASVATDVRPTKKIASGPLTSFELFPKLPPELRHMIWKFYLPGPRLIILHFAQDGRKPSCRFTGAEKLPFLLRVCHESRQVFTLRYKRSAFNHPQCTNGCYFNFERDRLGFGAMSAHGQRTRWLSHPTVANDIKHVKNVGFTHIEMWKELNGEEKRFRPLPLPTFMHFHSLQNVRVVFLIQHQEPCTWCRFKKVPPKDKEFLEDLKDRVKNLKSVFEEGKMYCFMFGKEWEPPAFVHVSMCSASLGKPKPKPSRNLNEVARSEDITNNPAEDTMDPAAQVNEAADSGSDIEERLTHEDFQQLFEEPMGSTSGTTDDDTLGGSETPDSETRSMMETDGASVDSISSSEAASMMETEGENLESTSSSESASMMGT